ncbi:MAG: ArsC/Spx/MgsR family protein [Nitrospirota bacterium]
MDSLPVRPPTRLCNSSEKPASRSPHQLLYYEKPFTKGQLKALIKKAKVSSRDMLRTQEDIYKELGLAKQDLSDDALIDLMILTRAVTKSSKTFALTFTETETRTLLH